jgi:hypothetical protein
MLAIYRREIQSYFYTSAAYVFLGVFLTLGSIFFGVSNLAARSGNLLALLSELSYLWMLLSPILTMRLIAGEKRQHTDQMLFASPCPIGGLVLGKYFAACSVLLLAVLATGVYALIVAVYGKLYIGETAAGYLGLILQGCAFIALRADAPIVPLYIVHHDRKFGQRLKVAVGDPIYPAEVKALCPGKKPVDAVNAAITDAMMTLRDIAETRL